MLENPSWIGRGELSFSRKELNLAFDLMDNIKNKVI